MRGVSNVVSAIFVIALIVTTVYTAMSALITHSEKIAEAAKAAVQRQIEISEIKYGEVTCDANSGLVDVRYEGDIGEYAIRLVCMNKDAYTEFCVVPFVYGNVNSVSYFDNTMKIPLEYNLARCDVNLMDDCQAGTLLCYIIGARSEKKTLPTPI